MMSYELLSRLITNAVIIGIGATIVMDLWGILLKSILGIVPLNYALVGRWLTYIPKGMISHNNIHTVKPVALEALIGWVVHYLIGIVFSTVLVILMGNTWLTSPSIVPAIIFGSFTVVFPYFIMQPCLGLGIAAAKTPKPNVARFRSLLTHTIFGLGLYFSAKLTILFLE